MEPSTFPRAGEGRGIVFRGKANPPFCLEYEVRLTGRRGGEGNFIMGDRGGSPRGSNIFAIIGKMRQHSQEGKKEASRQRNYQEQRS